ncbi:Lon protease 2, peroxisomal [Salvia divinorum]|uniref:Lon protease 2, peroxisomal n=1 Tax=Salvia divinorum TaxID=28513 RepID=A0ABD1HKR7_SALDI
MAESVELPDWPAILPSRKKVLLPGAIIRIRCTSFSRVKLVEQELWQREEKGLIGIVPFRDDVAESSTPGSLPSPGIGTKLREPSSKTVDNVSESHKHGAVNNQEVGHWHNRGIAARALHLSRQVKKPSGRVTYSVVLEGLWRFSVQELSTRGMYCTARITSLDMTKHEMDQVEQELDFIALSRQFKGTAMELISVLEQKQKTGGRTEVFLDSVPVHILADSMVARMF